jgi:ABC-type transport system involved in Fe-S cluster assembly fused permease/ATPase subunit
MLTPVRVCVCVVPARVCVCVCVLCMCVYVCVCVCVVYVCVSAHRSCMSAASTLNCCLLTSPNPLTPVMVALTYLRRDAV